MSIKTQRDFLKSSMIEDDPNGNSTLDPIFTENMTHRWGPRHKGAQELAKLYSPGKRAQETVCVITCITLIAIDFILIIKHIQIEKVGVACLSAICGIITADFGSGLVHWAADTWGTVDLPVIGKVAELFEPITMGAMPDNIDDWTLRADQRYLFLMVVSVNNGVCDEGLASLKPGPLSTARWLTTAARILRLYVTKKDPSEILIKLAEFVVKVYAPFWFLIKEKPEAIHGSRNVFKYIHWIRQLPMDVQMVIRPTIENNAFFFHPENILLSMITDTDSSEAGIIRSDAYEKIIAARIDPPATIRTFYVPRNTINFESTSYTKMIDWNIFNITEPPCLQFFLQCELEYHQYSNEIIKIPDFLCHSQNTERYVHVVSESATAVADDERLGHIFAKLDSRQRYSLLESRKDFAELSPSKE